jgi:predicted outer membrane repeat protein
MKRVKFIFALCFFCSCFIPSVQAGTIYVKASGSDENSGVSWTLAKKTVTAGLTAAISDDQVWVAAGTYNERITLTSGVALYGGFIGNETSLSQRNFSTNPTILDGQQGGSVVTSIQGNNTTRIDGFTIRNGTGTEIVDNEYGTIYRYGGGIYCYNTGLTVANCIINGNILPASDSVISCGGGIYCKLASYITIISCRINSNSAAFGGGIYCKQSSYLTIISSTISSNSATKGGGGGINCTVSYFNLTGTQIINNTASGSGGGILIVDSNVGIDHCSISNNSASLYAIKAMAGGGGGIYCSSEGNMSINNSSINDNSINASADYPFWIVRSVIDGGGIYSYNPQGITINNCIIKRNSISSNCTARGGGIYCWWAYSHTKIINSTIADNVINAPTLFSFGGAIACQERTIITNSIVAFNSSGISCLSFSSNPDIRGLYVINSCIYNPNGLNFRGFSPGTNFISVDPLFVNRLNDDYHLAAESPCIDQGSDSDALSGDYLDCDGQPRKAGSHVDIGADEYYILGDANGDTQVDVGDLGILAAHYGVTSGATWLTGDFNNDGIVDVGDLGILAAHYGRGTTSTSADFDADWATALGTTVTQSDNQVEDSVAGENNQISSQACSGLGLPLVLCLMLTGLMLIKLDE